jgi:hypothetical protein
MFNHCIFTAALRQEKQVTVIRPYISNKIPRQDEGINSKRRRDDGKNQRGQSPHDQTSIVVHADIIPKNHLLYRARLSAFLKDAESYGQFGTVVAKT